MVHRNRRYALLFALLFVTGWVPLTADARGGGGQHYSGGSHPSSAPAHSGGSSSSGGGRSSGGYYPSGGGYSPGGGYSSGGGSVGGLCCMLLVALVVVGIYYYLRKRGIIAVQRSFDAQETELRTSAGEEEVGAWVSALQARDPSFGLPALLDKAEAVFAKVQDGWFARDLTAARPFLSDATYERFALQLDLLAEQGVRNAITDIQVLDTGLIGLEQNADFDTVHLRVHAQMRDTDLPAQTSDADAVAAAKRAALEPFTEVWSFVRKPGAATRPHQDALNGKCPNCGAPFEGGAANNCTHCGAIVNSGHYDWVLAEITQGIEYDDTQSGVDGFVDLQSVDPAFNLEVLEDRASLVFWKWIAAQCHNDAGRITKLTASEYAERLAAELAALAGRNQRRFFYECAVGAVTVRSLRVVPGGRDEADVEIRWSARAGVAEAGRAPRKAPTLPQRWIFTLGRKNGAQTPTQTGMSTNRCPQCHAPLTDTVSPTCEYCGTRLSDGEKDWVLTHASTFEGWRRPASAPKAAAAGGVLANREERERLLYLMAAMAMADGVVDAKERKLLQTSAERWGVAWANVELALSAGPQLFERLITRDSPEADTLLRQLVKMALIDGTIDREERRMLQMAANHLGPPGRLEVLIREYQP